MTVQTRRSAIACAALLLALVPGGAAPAPLADTGCPDSNTAQAVAASVVVVFSFSGLRPQTATGFAIGPGRVVTVAHAVESASGVRVGRISRLDTVVARPLVVDSRRELAILDVPSLGVDGLGIADDPSAPGSCAVVVVARGRHPQLLQALLRRSVQATIDVPVPATREALELAVDVRRGDSGAPVLDDSGRVEGVIFAASSDHPSTGWAVSVIELRSLLASSA